MGELDMSCSDELERAVRPVITGPARRVVIDLRRLEFVDSTGLRVLLSLRNDAKRRRRELALVEGPPAVQRLFELSATRGLFDWTSPDGRGA